MQRKILNPFLFRASEKLQKTDFFLKLLSVDSLAQIEELNRRGELWGNVGWIRREPGAGKTTLLRMFSPEVLNCVNTNHESYLELYNHLRSLDVIKDNKILKCGVYLQIGSDFGIIGDPVFFDALESRTLSVLLLNVRVILSTLKAIMDLKELDLIGLSEIEYLPPVEIQKEFDGLVFPCNCKTLFEWCSEIEKKVSDVIYGGISISSSGLRTQTTLYAFKAMNTTFFKSEKNGYICDGFIFQLDDAHRMSWNQHKMIFDDVIANRINATLWISERLEVLPKELLIDTNVSGRDYVPYNLLPLTSGNFFKMATTIAEKRSGLNDESIDLKQSLDSELTSSAVDKYKEAYYYLKEDIESQSNKSLYDEWIKLASNEDSIDKKAICMQSILLFYNRQRKEMQRLFPYNEEEYRGIIDGALKSEAAMKISRDYGIPKFFGFKTLCEMSSSNIEQFLSFSAVLYDRMQSNKIKSVNNYRLKPEIQEDLLRKECSRKFNDLTKLPMGLQIKSFLGHLKSFCESQTFSPTASYNTVSGFAVSEEHRTDLFDDSQPWYLHKGNEQLAELIRICIAYNLLEFKTVKQGQKNMTWSVFYMNRWLCVDAGIPINYGGWKKIKIEVLKTWMKKEWIKK